MDCDIIGSELKDLIVGRRECSEIIPRQTDDKVGIDIFYARSARNIIGAEKFSARILASYVRRSSGTDDLRGSVVYRVRCDSSVCYVYFLVRYLQKDGMGRPVRRRFILQSVSDELY